ncbi:MAG: serine/threonine-protein kinase [Kofleriaceae bacterium]
MARTWGRTFAVIQVGQVLDKYELLERVGQGGMAIVYRGIDRTLKRTVAVKILHKHLSDYQEARDRFEREAQAVAKLRHENILEIFDYSAKEGSDSYIVTEFIEGQTLKQYVTARPIAFPEIGAMIILQVCRALAHAHAGSILHRDVKPENIMIRADGIVKLMDFGISHMVDLERLTVTGQLLGSPAYMAPEHVEGRPLDFRTDVFAAGIVLYQLTVGKLPFEGKNPHEVLKRIAECKFVDPRQANPRIGNRLGRIILKAMAAEPADRYAAIGEMVLAIEAYLEESGIQPDKVPAELARYFQAPASYEEALKTRLVDTLTRSGTAKLETDDRSGALDVFDRVLTIDPANEKVLAILDRLNRRARVKTAALAVAGCCVLVIGGYAIHVKDKPPPAGAPNINAATMGSDREHDEHVVHESRPLDAPPQLAAIAPDARPEVAVRRDARAMTTVAAPDLHEVQGITDAGALEPTNVEITVLGHSSYRLDKHGDFISIPDRVLRLSIDHPTDLEIQNPFTVPFGVHLEPGAKNLVARQPFRPITITPSCTAPDATVMVDGQLAALGQNKTLLFDAYASSSERRVSVVFTGGKSGKADEHELELKAGEAVEVKCDLH